MIEVLKALEMIMRLAQSFGLNWAKYKAIKDRAEAEGREPSIEELQGAIEDMDEAGNSFRAKVEAGRENDG